MGRLFGTDGIRGIANRDLSIRRAEEVGMALAEVIRGEHPEKRPTVVIGRDTRLSGEMLQAALAGGLMAGGADVVLEVAGSDETFRLAWQCARPNAVVTVVALYDEPQTLPLPRMYGKNLTFKTGGVDGCHCGEILDLIAAGRLDTTPLITHTFPLREIDRAYDLFEHHRDGVLKVAIECGIADATK